MNDASAVLFRRLPYYLSPQLDLYEQLPNLIRRGSVVLEIGFCTGAGVLQYSDIAGTVDALEVDPAAVRFARRVFSVPNVNWIERAIEDWSPGRAYDFIVMIETLEHVQNAKVAVAHVSSLLAEVGGQALITAPNILRYRARKEPLNVQEWTPNSFRALLRNYFGVVKLVEADLCTEAEEASRATPIVALCS